MQTAIQYHNELAPQWSGKYSKKSFAARATALLSFPEMSELCGQKWLDVGCGTGLLSTVLSDRGGFVIGLDASSEMIRLASKIPEDRHSDSTRKRFPLQGIAERLPFCGNAFDGVLCSSVIEYLADPQECLQEIHRVLKPGGRLIISVPNCCSTIRAMLKICAFVTSKCFGKAWPGYMEYSRLEYTKKGFLRLAASYNFDSLDFRWFSPVFPGLLSSLPFASLMIFSLEKRGANPYQIR